MPALQIGSAEHRALFCREFVDTFHPYEVREIGWPVLDGPDLHRLRVLPFWAEAVSSERTAGARVRAMADVEPDPELREAIAMQAYEESRHAALLESMLAHYGIAIPDGGGERPRDAEWGFLRMGYGECFDSFFAFGLFRLAADSGIFPRPLVDRFDGVMQEEARHILFFTNWVAYRRLHLPFHRKARFLVRRGLGISLQALGRVKTALQLRDSDEGDDFTMQVPESIGEVTMRTLAETCLRENERRLAGYDSRLLRPRLVPRLVRQAVRLMPAAKDVAAPG
ncbi:MAG TPA: hypothetical protein VEM57_04715 [Candidatus Binatus sp.]|nr:hypothetical protein [Candidatus Binatus sp.]